MFAFKVCVSTLVLVVIAMLFVALFKSEAKSGRYVALGMITVYALSIAAIWG